MNVTEPLSLDPSFGQQFLGAIYLTVSTLDIVLNGGLITLITILNLDHDSNRFLFIMALASEAGSYGAVVIICTLLEHWKVQVFKISCILISASTQGAALTLTAVVIDQYILIAHPLKYHCLMTRRMAVGIIAGIILVSALSCVAVEMLWDNPAVLTYYYNLPKWYHAIEFFIMLIAPILISATVQIKTIRISRRHLSQILDQPGCPRDSSHSDDIIRRYWSGVITTSLICLALILSWAPLGVLTVWYFIYSPEIGDQFIYFNLIASSMYSSYGIWTPLIYAVRSPEIRKVIKRLKIC